MRVDNSDKVPGSSDRTHTREVLGSEFKRCQRAPPMTYSLRGSSYAKSSRLASIYRVNQGNSGQST
jgi:hypothetical protein